MLLALVAFSLRTALLGASYLAPGWLALRAAGLPRQPAPAFVVSSALVYLVVLALALGGIGITLASVGLALLLVCFALLLLPKASLGPEPAGEATPPDLWTRSLQVALVLTGALFAWRAFAQPLTGPDTSFRWNLLALQIVDSGRLDSYPPVVLEHFARYFYPDGVAPFVAAQYAWTYLVFGSTAAPLTGFVVTTQFGATLGLAYALVKPAAGRVSGLVAAVAIASSALVFWAFHIGQETGWIALSLLAVWWCATRARGGFSVASGAVAALALLPSLVAREYGPVLLLAGAGLALGAGASWRQTVGFAAIAALVAAPWYVHVWLRCGNPFYSLSPLELFPVNETLRDLLASYRERFALPRQQPAFLAYRALDVAVGSSLVLLLTAAAVRNWRRTLAPLGAAGLILALWFTSAGYTSGGLHIANRVAVPAAILLAVAGASVWRIGPGASTHRSRPLASAVLLSVLWSFYLNAAPPAGPTGPTLRVWFAELTRLAPGSTTPSHPPLPVEGRILTDNAYLHAHHSRTVGAPEILPYWAPECSFLLSPSLDAAEAARRLRALGVTAVHLSGPASPNWTYWSRFPFFSQIAPAWPRLAAVRDLPLHSVPLD